MKIYLLTAVSICITNIVSAQSIKPSPLTFKAQVVAPQAVLISTTIDQKVYALPQDNTPCLVPDISKVTAMPNAVGTFNNTMPNAMPQQSIIPSNTHDGRSSAFNDILHRNLQYQFLTPAQIMPVPKKLTIQ